MTGGNSTRICLMNTPTRIATRPPTSMAPAMAAMPPPEAATACMLGTYAKLTPMMTGNPEPNRPAMG